MPLTLISAPVRSSLSFLILLSATAIALPAARTTAPIDAIFAPHIDAQSPGAAVLIRKNGRTVFTRAYGVTDLNTRAALDARTNFRLASFTKQFTAMAVMLLVHDGKLRYEQNLVEIFPGFPAYGRAITVRHLLTHTSGLADYETLMQEKQKAEGGSAIWSRTKQIHDDEVLAVLAHETHGIFEPGTRWAYSNSGYVVLGIIVAKVSGMPFADFLHKRIFAPLKMSHTVAFMNGVNVVRRRAYGFSKVDGDFQDTDQSDTSATLGDGGVYSNLLDLARWDDALANNKLLSKSEMAPALEPVKLNDGSPARWPAGEADGDNLAPGKPVSYGFGWFLSPVEGRPCMWHTGSTSGFRTVIERFSDTGLTIVILLNRTDLDTLDLAKQILHADTGLNKSSTKNRKEKSKN